MYFQIITELRKQVTDLEAKTLTDLPSDAQEIIQTYKEKSDTNFLEILFHLFIDFLSCECKLSEPLMRYCMAVFTLWNWILQRLVKLEQEVQSKDEVRNKLELSIELEKNKSVSLQDSVDRLNKTLIDTNVSVYCQQIILECFNSFSAFLIIPIYVL